MVAPDDLLTINNRSRDEPVEAVEGEVPPPPEPETTEPEIVVYPTCLGTGRDREATAAGRGEQAAVDLTMPARHRWQGSLHPVTLVIREIEEIFRELGFTVALGPEAETEWYNFGSLNFPPDHPARASA